MATDPLPEKACCAALKASFSKLEEKRNALRQAVKLLEHQINIVQDENCKLQKAHDKERAQVKQEREAKENEFNARCKLENELSSLKEEISALKANQCSRGLKDWEAEVNKLLELLELEKKRGDAEKKKAEVEKKKAAEAWKLLKAEKSKVEQERKLAFLEKKREDEMSACLEALKTEAKKANEGLILEKAKAEEAKQKADVEKQKADKEKKRADLLMMKSEEQKRYAENMGEELAQEREKVDALQKEVKLLTSAGKECRNCLCTMAKADKDRKSLKRQLKEEKIRAKETKKSSKHETVRDYLVQQEVSLLKQDALQFSHRLQMLESCFSHGLGGIDGSRKMAGGCRELSGMNTKYRPSHREVDELHYQDENELIKSNIAIGDFRLVGTANTGTMPLHPVSWGSCSQLIPGINSELESLDGGSTRKKLQDSGMHSTSTSISDRKLMGSQGRDAFCNSTSAKSAGENSKQGSTFSKLTDETAKEIQNANICFMAKRSNGSLLNKDTKAAPLNSISLRKGVEDRPNIGRKKRKKVSKLNDDISEKKQNENIGFVGDSGGSFFIDNASNSARLDSSFQEDEGEHKTCHGTREKKRVPSQHVLATKENKLLFKIEKKLTELHLSFCQKYDRLMITLSKREANCYPDGNGIPLDNKCVTPQKPPKRQKVDSRQELFAKPAAKDLENLLTEKLGVRGGYMKLLELDNEADEERYRLAMRIPVSPSLPEVQFPCRGISSVDVTDYLLEGVYKGLGSNELNQPDAFDVVDVEIDSNRSKFRSSGSSMGKLCDITVVPSNLERKLLDKDIDVGHSRPGMSQMSSMADDIVRKRSICKHLVVFPNMMERSISQILCATEDCMPQSTILCESTWAISEILLAVASQGHLPPEEKACVFFSMLLYNFSIVVSANLSSAADVSAWKVSFAKELNEVMSNVQLGSLMIDMCKGDTLLGLIEDFLIDRRVIECNYAQDESIQACDSSRKLIIRDDMIIVISSIVASIDQLKAGAVTLASICLLLGHIGFVCEASYNILRTCRADASWVLTVLHLFASVCGREYFEANNYWLVMTTIRSVVSKLEERETERNQTSFLQCAQCPFAQLEGSMETVASLLLNELQNHVNLRTADIVDKEVEEISASGICSHSIIMNKKHTSTNSLNLKGRTLCNYSEVVSLLELLGAYSSWNWIYDKLIPCLLKKAESLASGELSAAILVLIGQLGRFGLEDSGCEQLMVVEIVSRLSKFLSGDNGVSYDLATQFAAVSALVTLVSLDYEKIFHRQDPIDNKSQFRQCIDIMRKWFSQLRNEQHLLLTTCLFQSCVQGQNRR